MNVDCLPFSRSRLADLIELLSGNARRRWPAMTPMLPGDLAWQLPGSAPKENLRLYYSDATLIGYAWFQPPGSLAFDVRSDTDCATELLPQILDWAEARQRQFESGFPFYLTLQSMAEWADALRTLPEREPDPNRYLVTSALATDSRRIALLEAAGYSLTEHFSPHLARSLDDLKVPEAPEGIVVRAVGNREFAARVEVHRAAWAPSSGFTLERYLQVRAITDIFDPGLDLVAVDESGQFLSCCIAWADPGSGLGFFEPFGTHPDGRGRGVSRALVLGALQALKDRGMQYARIYTAGFNHAARRLYESCGFVERDRELTLIKALH